MILFVLKGNFQWVEMGSLMVCYDWKMNGNKKWPGETGHIQIIYLPLRIV